MDSVVGKTCPFCQFPVKSGDEVQVCSQCEIPHHAPCWRDNGGCTTFGCCGLAAVSRGSAVATKKGVPETSSGESWLGVIFVVIAVMVLGPWLLSIVLPLVGISLAIFGVVAILGTVVDAVSGPRRR